jgi:putative ABC transport system permease protein
MAVMLILGLGIGASTTVASIADRVLLRPLPYPQSDRLAALARTDHLKQPVAFSPRLVLALQQHAATFDQIAAFQFEAFNFTRTEGTDCIQGAVVTPNLFQLLRSGAILGRALLPQLDGGGARTVVISHRFWQRYLAGRGDVIGSALRLNGESYTIAGVMRKTFRFDRGAGIEGGLDFSPHVDLWAPLLLDPADGRSFLLAIGRLRNGQTLGRARQELQLLARRLESSPRESPPDLELDAGGLHDNAVRRLRPAVLILLGSGLMLLLVACVNAFSLVVAETIARRSELGTRIALGATRGSLFLQSVRETLATCLGGWIFALAFFAASGRIVARVFQDSLPGVGNLSIDGSVIAFSLVPALLLTVLLSCATPALARYSSLHSLLAGQGRGRTADRQGRALQRLFVTFQLALSFVLLLGAILMLRSMLNLLSLDRGFEARGVLTAQLALPAKQYPDGKAVVTALSSILDALRGQSSLAASGLVSVLPLGGFDRSGPGFVVEGPTPLAIPAQVSTPLVSGGYFPALKIQLLEGRLLSDEDTETAPGAVVVSATLAKKYFPHHDAIGKVLSSLGGRLRFTIVGVVADVRHAGLQEAQQPILYIPYRQVPFQVLPVLIRPVTLVARGQEGHLPSETIFQDAVRRAAPFEAVANVKSMADVVSDSLIRERIALWTVASLGVAELLLALFGVHAMVTRVAADRRREIGIRTAFGASPWGIATMILGSEVRWAGAGILLGTVFALPLTRYLTSQFFTLRGTDPLSFLAVAAGLLSAVLLSGCLPVLRASRSNPIEAISAR